jgi:Helix-turn-helix domain
MMRLIYAKRNTFSTIFPNTCPTVSLEPHSGIFTAKESLVTERKVNAKYLGVQEAQELTGISRWTWRRYAYNGIVESIKIGKRLLIPSSEIERLVSEGTRPRLQDGR